MTKPKAGLGFASPTLGKMNIGPAPNPYAPFTPTAGIGIDNLGGSLAEMKALGEQLVSGTQFTMPKLAPPPPDIGINEGTGELFVQGRSFAADDAATALQAEEMLNQPGTGQLPAGYTPLDAEAYRQYTNSIRNPSIPRLARKNFGRGVDVTQLLVGRGLQLAGAEEFGGNIVAAQEADLAKTAPFERQFTDIQSGDDAVEWFVANLAQQGPNLIESVLTAGIGAAVGSATGPAGTVGGAIAGLAGKSAFKDQIKLAAAKRAALGREAWSQSINAAKQKSVAKEVLTPAETQLLKDDKVLRQAAGIAGAVTASFAQNIGTGAADIYGELRESGATADDTTARLTALAGSLPYAALETLPEYLLIGRVLSGAGAPARMAPGTSLTRRGLEYGRRFGVGFAAGGVAEGTTEAGQEGLLLGLSGKDFTSPESVDRLINSFAAGFAIGGPLGGAANLRSKEEVNLLNPGQSTTPAIPSNAPAGTQGELFETAGAVAPVPGLQTPDESMYIPGASGPYSILTPTDIPPATRPASGGQQELFPGLPLPPEPPPSLSFVQAPGTQGEMFGQVGPTSEIPGLSAPGNLYIPNAAGPYSFAPPMVTPPATDVSPDQGTFQFAPPPPAGMGFTDRQPPPDTQIADQFRALQRQQEFDRAVAQRRQMETAQAEAQRQLQMVPAETPAEVVPVRGPRALRAREPQQLSLFGPRELPRPSGAERLRRGATPLPEPVVETPPPGAAELRRAGQLAMFTQKGEPSVAALKGAGVRLRQGEDLVEFDDGAKFVGMVARGNRPVRGVMTWPDGSRFDGEFDKKGMPKTGTGRLVLNGYTDDGEYKDGMLARGTREWDSGAREEGEFQDNNLYNGTITYADGDTGTYENGKLKEEPPPPPKPLKKRKQEAPPKEDAKRPKEQAAKAASEKPKKTKAPPPKQEQQEEPPKQEQEQEQEQEQQQEEPPKQEDDDERLDEEIAKKPVSIVVTDERTGAKVMLPDGGALLDRLNADIRKFEAFLACLRG
jgi:hypothetical protein